MSCPDATDCRQAPSRERSIWPPCLRLYSRHFNLQGSPSFFSFISSFLWNFITRYERLVLQLSLGIFQYAGLDSASPCTGPGQDVIQSITRYLPHHTLLVQVKVNSVSQYGQPLNALLLESSRRRFARLCSSGVSSPARNPVFAQCLSLAQRLRSV